MMLRTKIIIVSFIALALIITIAKSHGFINYIRPGVKLDYLNEDKVNGLNANLTLFPIELNSNEVYLEEPVKFGLNFGDLSNLKKNKN